MKKVLAGLMLLPLLTAAAAAQTCGWPWAWCGVTPLSGVGGFMMLFWLIVLALIVYLVIAYGKNREGGAAGRPGGRAMEILKERYAKGEITKEQFEQMKKDILG